MSQEIEIGLGKKGRLAYSLNDVSIVPSRRTRDPQDVSTSWQVDAYEFDVPVIGAPMDSDERAPSAIAMEMGAAPSTYQGSGTPSPAPVAATECKLPGDNHDD